MMNRQSWVLVILFSAIFNETAFSQEPYIKKTRMVILPSSLEAEKGHSAEITDLVMETMNQLGRFEVIDRRTTDATLQEIALGQTGLIREDQVIQVGKLLGSKVGVIVMLHDWQVDKKQIEKYTIEKKGKKGKETEVKTKIKDWVYSAHISIGFRQLDIESGKTFNAFTVESGEGKASTGARAISGALARIRGKLLGKLRVIYPLKLRVIEKTRDTLIFLGGRKVGVRNGAVVEIFQPDRIVTIDGKEVTIGGERIGLGKITSVEDEISRGIILRGYPRIRVDTYGKERYGKREERGRVAIANYRPSSGAIMGEIIWERRPMFPPQGLGPLVLAADVIPEMRRST